MKSIPNVFKFALSDIERIREVDKIPNFVEIPEQFKPFLSVVETDLSSDSSGHDREHVIRVLKLALQIHSREGGDSLVIGVAALFHDLLRPWEKQQKDEGVPKELIKSHFCSEAIEIIRAKLEKFEHLLSSNQIENILNIIALHEDYRLQKSAKSIELQVVQDADWLDAIGAIGLLRAAMFAGNFKDKMFVYGELLPRGGFIESPGKKGGSLLNHVYEKLLAIGKMMNTMTGAKMAQQRDMHMAILIDFFFQELGEVEC